MYISAKRRVYQAHQGSLGLIVCPALYSSLCTRCLQDSHSCSRCFSAPVCAAYHAAIEGGDAGSSGLEAEQWQEYTRGITPASAAWLRHWLDLLDWEESGARARRPEVWALTGEGVVGGLLLAIASCSGSPMGGGRLGPGR